MAKMSEEISEDEENFKDELFTATMGKKWDEVLEIYKKHKTAPETLLTKAKETALHIAISAYHSKHTSSTNHIDQMIDMQPNVLSMKNIKGDTPLHIAAAVCRAPVCRRIASKNREILISIRNNNGETPLFVAAYYGNLQAFLALYEELEEGRQAHESYESLCRRTDGNTALHSAISGEYFKLAYWITQSWPKLVNSVNTDGDTPLHVLARKPDVFKSSSNFGLYDSIIYYSAFVDDLRDVKSSPRSNKSDYSLDSEIKLPENWRTCENIFVLLTTPIVKSFLASRGRDNKQNDNQTDEENQNNQETRGKTDHTNRIEKRKESYPPNYITGVLLFKFLTKIILTVLGVGYWRIRKIKNKKERYHHAQQIMNEMIKHEAEYKYSSNGQRPDDFGHDPIESGINPNSPPQDDENESSNSMRTNTGMKGSSGKDQQMNGCDRDQSKSAGNMNDLARKDTALLVAAKMGIPEMVRKIISKCPPAIDDLDYKRKNVLLLAAEHRHVMVFEYLLKLDLPKYMFHQLDDEGNNILHLAACLGHAQPWSIPGAALQMQWELKWFKHVKNSVPPLSTAHNLAGETPRQIFTRTHRSLVKEGNDWLIKTSESCSVVAALIAAVAFATAATVPGGLDQNTGHPVLQQEQAFNIFSITALLALCLSVTALVFFLAIITSRCQEHDFKGNLPNKLLMGLSSLFASIIAVLMSFCAGHTFTLSKKLKLAAWPIYGFISLPVTFFALAQLPLYFDLLWASWRRIPLRSYKVFYH